MYQVVQRIQRLNRISAEPGNTEWQALIRTASANQRHYHCGGFRDMLMHRALAVLNRVEAQMVDPDTQTLNKS